MNSGSSAGLPKSGVYLSLTRSATKEKIDHLVDFAEKMVFGDYPVIKVTAVEGGLGGCSGACVSLLTSVIKNARFSGIALVA